MTEITMTLDPNSIEAAIQKLKAYKKKLNTNLENVVSKLAVDGTRVAKSLYSSVTATVAREDDPTNVININLDFTQDEYRHIDVTQEAESKRNKLTRYVVARGSGVGFAEFGAGAFSDYNAPFAKNAPFPVYGGSWSEQDARMYSRYGKWYFNTLTYYGIAPARGLYEAYKEMSGLAYPYLRYEFMRGNRL